MRIMGFCIAILSGLAAGATAAGSLEGVRLSMAGAGPLRIGMSQAQVERVLGRKLAPAEDYEEDTNCRYATPEGIADGLGLMLIDGRLVRIDVEKSAHQSLSGARVGDTSAAVRRKIGGLRDSEHAYSGPEGRYLTKYSSDRRRGIRFEIEDGKVSRYYVGTSQAIQYVEGCL